MKFLRIFLMSLFPWISCSAAILLVDQQSSPPEGAYPSIQAAVDAATPGDVIQIRGGVYFERIHLTRSGERGRPIVVEAVPGQTVLINAGRQLPLDWKPVGDLPATFVAEVPADVEIGEDVGIWEMPSRLRLARVPSRSQVAQRPGSWYFDTGSRRLALRGTGSVGPGQAAYWLEAAGSAVRVTASHIQLRNLQTTLGRNGILLDGKKTSHVTVEGCRSFCNSWAGIHVTGDHHIIRDNESFENNTYGIQLRYGVNFNRILRNQCLFNGPNNGAPSPGTSVPTDLGIYSLGGYNLFEGNIVEGFHEDVYRNKTGHGENATNVLRNNVIKGHQTVGHFGVHDNTLLVSGLGMRPGMFRNGGAPNAMRDWKFVDPDGLLRATNLIHPLEQSADPLFADTAYRDYRLQNDTPYPGRGAHPERGTVFYVDPRNGSDENDGLSLAKALATPAAALARMGASTTLYLLPGDYTAPLQVHGGGLEAGSPLRIRAYGKRPGVRISGRMRVQGGQFVAIEGLEFSSQLGIEATMGVSLSHCIFDGKGASVDAKDSQGIQIKDCTFVHNDTSLRLTTSSLAITGSLFQDCGTVYSLDAESLAGLFSDFNAFSVFRASHAGEDVRDLAAWRKRARQDAKSRSGAFELMADHALPMGSPLAAGNVDFGPLGARIEDAAARLDISHLRVAGLSPTGATLLWETPHKASLATIRLQDAKGNTLRSWEPSFFVQIMGTQFDVTRFTEAFYFSQRHAGIDGLKPDTAYTAIVTARDLSGSSGQPVEIAFRTPSRPVQPVTYYVAPTGKDANEGLTPETAWATLAHATAAVSPGDEIILLPGVYRETLRPRISGTTGHPITIRAEQPRTAILDLGGSLPVGVEILNAHHLTISGLLFQNGAFPHTLCFSVNHARGITIRDCAMDWPAGSTLEKLKLGYGGGIIASHAPGLTVTNNLFLCGTVGVAAAGSPEVRITHNTFVGEGNYGIVLIPSSVEDRVTITDNLFYRAIMGYKSNPCLWVFGVRPQITSNHNLFFIPKDHKGTIGVLPGTERLAPIGNWITATGLDTKSLEAEPRFTNPTLLDFSLESSSPGKNAGSDGKDIGWIPN